MMRAARFTGDAGIEMVSCPTPNPAPTQVLVRLEGCGVCGSNLPVWEGRPWFEYPREPGTPGHEGWGVIERVGAQVTPACMGRRVAMLSAHAFAELDVAETIQIVPIPEVLGALPCPGEPLACAVNVMRRARIRAGQTVVVIGVGFLGALLVRLASYAGARVVAISRRSWARDLAKRLGAEYTWSFGDRAPLVAALEAETSGRLADCVIEAIGNQEALDLSTDLTGIRGRLLIAGYHQDGPRQINLQQWNWRGLDVINAHERDDQIYVRGMIEAVQLLQQGVIDLDPLLTHHVPFDDLGSAFRLMQQRPDGYLKAFVSFGAAT